MILIGLERMVAQPQCPFSKQEVVPMPDSSKLMGLQTGVSRLCAGTVL